MLDALLLLKNLTSAVQPMPLSSQPLQLAVPYSASSLNGQGQALSMGLNFESIFKYSNGAANRAPCSETGPALSLPMPRLQPVWRGVALAAGFADRAWSAVAVTCRTPRSLLLEQ